MKSLFHFAVSASLLIALVAGISYAFPGWSTRVGLNFAEWLEVQRQLEDERRREVVLSDLTQRTAHSLQAKSQVVEELRHRRLTLLEAAARFRDLSRPGRDDFHEWFRRAYPGKTDEERWCRQVIRFLRGHSLKLEPLAEQYEAELARRLANGPLELPQTRPTTRTS